AALRDHVDRLLGIGREAGHAHGRLDRVAAKLAATLKPQLSLLAEAAARLHFDGGGLVLVAIDDVSVLEERGPHVDAARVLAARIAEFPGGLVAFLLQARL